MISSLYKSLDSISPLFFSLSSLSLSSIPLQKVLTVNADDHIFRGRYINANDLVAHGGFGSICFCKDLASEKMFAIKQNCKSKDLYIDSIHKEACILSHLGKNDHVIQMYGAVLDEEETEFPPPRVNKMMIELAERE